MTNWDDIAKMSSEEIGRELINYLIVDQLTQLSTLTEEQVYSKIGDARYEDEIQDIITELNNNLHDDLGSQKGIGRVVQRVIDLDDYRDEN